MTAGCGRSDDSATGSSSIQTERSSLIVSNGRELNGRELNGRELNGRELNGRELNGRELNGMELNGVELNGRELNGRELNGRELNGRELNGRELNGKEERSATGTGFLEGSMLKIETGKNSVLSGAEVIGTVFTATFKDGSTERASIDGMAVSDTDVYSYEVNLLIDGAKVPWCGTDANGQAVKAVPLQGTWSSESGDHRSGGKVITLACQGFALAKCVAFGYKPWVTLPSGVSLADHHQACTRMVRADYCGDGNSYTQNGTLINIYDAHGIQADTESWSIEAEWTTKGARCLEKTRIVNTVPECAKKLAKLPKCGDTSHFSSGALLMTEAP